MEAFFEELINELQAFLGFILKLLKDIFSIVPKVLSFSLWVFTAVFILPCVFVAGTLYPLWEKWGEDF